MRKRSSKSRPKRQAHRQGRSPTPFKGTLSPLASRLRARLGMPVRIELTDNTYTMISFSRRAGVCFVRLHHMFRRAPQVVQESLASYLRGDDRRASINLNDFIEGHRHLIRKLPAWIRQQRIALRTDGQVHDLQRLLDEVRDQFFDGDARSVAISWAAVPRVQTPRRSIKLGSYSADAHLIRIHPALDQPFVPAYFVRWIIYHELLHHRFRRDLGTPDGRVHPPLFRALELMFPEVRAAMTWERRNIETLLQWGVTGTLRAAG